MKQIVILSIVAVLCTLMLCWIVSNPTKIDGKVPMRVWSTLEAYKEKHSQGMELQDMLQPLQGNVVSTVPSRLIYLVQTESCLPDHLTSVEAFGDVLACQCDVLVLGYKEACRETALPNVDYLFNSSTTWASGRNLLLKAAMRKSEKYLYYIFMDDDIVLNTTTKQQNPWREFEDFLKRIEPAVASVETFPKSRCLPAVYNARKDQGCGLDETAECLPVVRIDPAYNAFHYQAVEYLLPYFNRFDADTWWASGVYITVKCEIMFRGQVVIHTILRAINTLHRPYPRNAYDTASIVNEVVAELPKEYQESSLVMEWKRDGLKHQQISSTLCLPPPSPHMPIKPYAHFDGKAEGL